MTEVDAGRRRSSWAGEIAAALVNAFPNCHGDIPALRELSRKVCLHPEGGSLSSDKDPESLFIWGRVRHLVEGIHALEYASDEVWRNVIKRDFISEFSGPRIVIHTDKKTTISPEARQRLTSQRSINMGSIDRACKILGKADVLIVPSSHETIAGLSVKVGTGNSEVKLSQQSTAKTYNFIPKPSALIGGMKMDSLGNIDSLLSKVPQSQIVQGNTHLTGEQFSKLSTKDKKFAFIKAQYPDEWSSITDSALLEANGYLEKFGRAISGVDNVARANLQELLAKRLIGDLIPPSGYQMWLSGITKPINIGRLFADQSAFRAVRRLEAFMRPSESGKQSLVVRATLNDGNSYVVCKIEPGFDGGGSTVSQTKGIVYYFQEGRVLGLPTVWELISAIGIRH